MYVCVGVSGWCVRLEQPTPRRAGRHAGRTQPSVVRVLDYYCRRTIHITLAPICSLFVVHCDKDTLPVHRPSDSILCLSVSLSLFLFLLYFSFYSTLP